MNTNKYNTIKKNAPLAMITRFIMLSYFKCMKYARTRSAFTLAIANAITALSAPKSIRDAATVTTVKTIRIAKTLRYVFNGIM